MIGRTEEMSDWRAGWTATVRLERTLAINESRGFAQAVPEKETLPVPLRP